MDEPRQLLPLSKFQEKARINYKALKAFEEMGFVTPYVVKTGEWPEFYYPLEEAKIIRKLQDFITGDHGPIDLRQAHRMAADALNSES